MKKNDQERPKLPQKFLQKKKIDEKSLTYKQAVFLKEYLKTGSGVTAALKAYNCRDRLSARNMASETLARHGITIKDILEYKGLTQAKMAKVVKDATKAKKYILSHTEPDREVPDHQIRLKAVELMGKWTGLEKQDISIDNRQIHNTLTFVEDDTAGETTLDKTSTIEANFGKTTLDKQDTTGTNT